ncbi:hypothetical protein [Paenibacillus tarimensis]|uniref:hypothetical protein n=1 Tax=Paenibacillus tarimensis TaxID=416012 RepID=UPI001F1F7E5D|nr:hypothetical protein [Paenibacillus tarimensis]MCF2945715.1 hypothetical protein [Paenibacillus tarimensis]
MLKMKWTKLSLTAVMSVSLAFGAAACGNADNDVTLDGPDTQPDTTVEMNENNTLAE